MTLMYDVVQGESHWHDLRLQNIGSSECSALFGLQASYAQSAFTLWQVKSGKIKPPHVDDSPGSRVWFGKRMEPIIGKMAAELYGWDAVIQPGPFAVDDQTSGMSGSLDGVIQEPGKAERELGFKGPGVLEIKRIEWLQFKMNWTDSEPPFGTVLQNQHLCACAGFSWGVVAALVSEIGFVVYRYPARPGVASRIRHAVDNFWKSVRDGVPPNPDHTASSAAALKELYPPRADPVTIDLTADSEADITAAAFKMAQAHRKESSNVYDLQRNLIMYKLRGANLGETEHHWISGEANKNGVVTIKVREKVPT